MTYPGGKNGAGVFQRIINLVPPHDVYIEPFLGSGALMRLKRPARLNIGVDLELAALSLAMQAFHHHTAETAMPPGRRPASEMAMAPGTARAGPLKNGDAVLGAGILIENGGDCRRRSSFAAMADPLDGSGEGRSPIFEFHQQDGIEFLARYPFRGNGGELVYCDPPYMMLSERSGKAIYTHELSADQHLRLLRLLRRLPCLILISGYWSALYARELQAWNHITFEGHTRKGAKTEWLWFNFPEPVALHDYRYLGRGFRERERIKRKTARWTAKLERMPVLERQALLSAIGNLV